jgi:hypothetical protein
MHKEQPMTTLTTPTTPMAGATPATPHWQGSLARDAHGRLVFTDAHGSLHEGVQAVRAFPIEAPQAGLSLIGSDGHELAWTDCWIDLPEATRELLAEELAQREVMPVIHRLVGVSTYATPSTWTVETDRGTTPLILKGEEDIRRLRDGGLLITDNHGLVFRVRELKALDKASRKMLDRFL